MCVFVCVCLLLLLPVACCLLLCCTWIYICCCYFFHYMEVHLLSWAGGQPGLSISLLIFVVCFFYCFIVFFNCVLFVLFCFPSICLFYVLCFFMLFFKCLIEYLHTFIAIQTCMHCMHHYMHGMHAYCLSNSNWWFHILLGVRQCITCMVCIHIASHMFDWLFLFCVCLIVMIYYDVFSSSSSISESCRCIGSCRCVGLR